MTDPAPAIPSLPPRPPQGHKGTFGSVAVIGGQVAPVRMIGGPALCAIAALRTGAGLVRLVMPEPILSAGLTIAPSATGWALTVDRESAVVPHLAAETFDRALAGCSCLAVGPGLGVSPGAEALALRAVGQTDRPVVVDADALNALAQTPAFEQDCRARAVFTPHPGEFTRLAAVLGVRADPVSPEERPRAAADLARRLGAVVVLKGAHTVVSDGLRTWIDDTADPVLATAGTGDVLTGVIAGLIAQYAPAHDAPAGLELYDCARLGVRIHATAAGVWRERHSADTGLLAQKLTECIPAALALHRGAPD